MEEYSYLNFDLLFEKHGGGYRARVLNSPTGQATRYFEIPYSDLEIENFILRIGRPRRGFRRMDSPEMEASKSFGERLFVSVFDGEIRDRLRTSLDEASNRGQGLRIQLRMTEVPELVNLPWEYLYDPDLKQFLVLSAQTPIVRYLDLPKRIQPLKVDLPLRMLVMISGPSDYPPLDVEREWERLRQSLADLEQQSLVQLERHEQATLIGLQRQLRRFSYHIFHFVGHGSFDEASQDGVLLFEDESGRGRRVSGSYLGTLLHDEPLLRLAVLNACEGARTSGSDPFAGAAQSLVLRGIPAVIAMQFEITDKAAVTFGHEFYSALSDGCPVDAAIAEARKAIYALGNDIEWGTPVLYMRAPDGRIFDIPKRIRGREVPSLSISVKPNNIMVEPGQSASTSVIMHNLSPNKCRFETNVRGVPGAWISGIPIEWHLSPGEQQKVKLMFQPPRSSESRAGRYPFTLHTVNKDIPDQAFEEEAVLTVSSFSRVTSELRTKNIKVGEAAVVEVRNAGNIQESVELNVQDHTGALDFQPVQTKVEVSPGDTRLIELLAKSRTQRFLGREQSYPFDVNISSATGKVQSHRGIVVIRGLFPVWVVPAMIFLCIALIVGTALIYRSVIIQPELTQVEAETPTPTDTPIPTPTDTPKPTIISGIGFEEDCILANTWTPYPPESVQTDANNCWKLSNWGMEARDNGLLISTSEPSVDIINGIYSQIDGDVTIDFNIRVDQLWTSVDDVPTNIGLGILPGNLSSNSGNFVYYQKESPANGYPVFMKHRERGGFDAYMTQNGEYVRYPLGRVDHITMSLVADVMNIYLNGYRVAGPLEVTFQDRVFWIGYRLPVGGAIEAHISEISIQ